MGHHQGWSALFDRLQPPQAGRRTQSEHRFGPHPQVRRPQSLHLAARRPRHPHDTRHDRLQQAGLQGPAQLPLAEAALEQLLSSDHATLSAGQMIDFGWKHRHVGERTTKSCATHWVSRPGSADLWPWSARVNPFHSDRTHGPTGCDRCGPSHSDHTQRELGCDRCGTRERRGLDAAGHTGDQHRPGQLPSDPMSTR